MNPLCDVWITPADHGRLMTHLFPGDNDEHGAVLKAGIVDTDKGLRLLVREIVVAEGADYGPGRVGYRALSPNFIHNQIIACRDQRLAYLAVHNHDCDEEVGFSTIDVRSHELGYPALRDIGKGVPVGALVYGRSSVEADIWMADGSRARLGEYRIVGPAIERFYARPLASTHAPASMDRQVRMFGAAGQALLQKAKIAIIGLGGVGSLVSEFVARLGVGELLLIDPDTIEETNLARVVGATLQDVTAKRSKVEIAERVARDANVDIRIAIVTDDVAKCSIAEQLKTCDFIFLCADSMRARLVCNAVTHQYFVPMVQLGAKVRHVAGSLVDLVSVVRQVRAGDGCLWCNGWIDAGQLALESKSDEERKDQAYGTNEPNPSVIALNAVSAAHGVNDFLLDYLGLREPADTARYTHFHHLGSSMKRVVPRKDPDCRECGVRLGYGSAATLPCILA